jgi:hypothetical protein
MREVLLSGKLERAACLVLQLFPDRLAKSAAESLKSANPPRLKITRSYTGRAPSGFNAV